MSADLAAAVRAAMGGCAQADPEAAPVRMRCLKSPFDVLGCRVPVINEAAHSADSRPSSPPWAGPPSERAIRRGRDPI